MYQPGCVSGIVTQIHMWALHGPKQYLEKTEDPSVS